ncbi:hypothetical protein D3C75_1331990 [compost metagenome]
MVTSSSTANQAHSSAVSSKAAVSHTVMRDRRGESCKVAPATSGMKSRSAVLPKLCK